MKVLRSIFNMMKICISTKEGKVGLIFYISALLLNIAGTRIAVMLIHWNRTFWDAIGEHDVATTVYQLGIFVVIIGASAATFLVGQYLQRLLQIRWRKVLTQRALDIWLRDKNYWYLTTSDKSELDNPDQRIAEECRTFVEHLTNTTLDFIGRIIALVTFVVVLWNVAPYALSFTVFGLHIYIPRYMVWAAPVYVAISSVLTHVLGKPLIGLNIEQRHREAYFRFALTRFREGKEAIALQSGEAVERDIIDSRFVEIVKNWRAIIKRDFILGCFTRPYFQTILRIPTFLALPIFFVQRTTLGVLMQISAAFQNVATTLSWFIFSYRTLADLAASSVRFNSFLSAAESFEYKPKTLPTQADKLTIDNFSLYTPEDKLLFEMDKTTISNGQTFLIQGSSGKGKTTLFRTLAGLHHNYTGQITVPKNKSMFLPQKAYFPLGGLAHAVSYPGILDENNIPQIKEILEKVDFPQKDIEQRLMQYDTTKLSGGEQQRLVIARVIFNKPEWIFMDESTNALDNDSEKFLIELMQTELPESTFVIISHSDAVHDYAKNYYRLAIK